LTICAGIHINKRTTSDKNAPVKCRNFVSARVPVSASISAADVPCRSSTVWVSKGFLAVDRTSEFLRAGNVEKERKAARFGKASCRSSKAPAIVVVVVEVQVVWCGVNQLWQ